MRQSRTLSTTRVRRYQNKVECRHPLATAQRFCNGVSSSQKNSNGNTKKPLESASFRGAVSNNVEGLFLVFKCSLAPTASIGSQTCQSASQQNHRGGFRNRRLLRRDIARN